jgi:cell division protein FtsB
MPNGLLPRRNNDKSHATTGARADLILAPLGLSIVTIVGLAWDNNTLRNNKAQFDQTTARLNADYQHSMEERNDLAAQVENLGDELVSFVEQAKATKVFVGEMEADRAGQLRFVADVKAPAQLVASLSQCLASKVNAPLLVTFGGFPGLSLAQSPATPDIKAYDERTLSFDYMLLNVDFGKNRVGRFLTLPTSKLSDVSVVDYPRDVNIELATVHDALHACVNTFFTQYQVGFAPKRPVPSGAPAAASRDPR